MNIPVFLSFPKPINDHQDVFIKGVEDHLRNRGLEPTTLGVDEYDMEAPLVAIRRMMLAVNGLVTVAFRRYHVERGTQKSGGRTDQKDLSGSWFTSPYCQIEPAMAFQLGLPILVLREKGVHPDGLLERGALGINMPEFDAEDSQYFNSSEWRSLAGTWEGYVRSVCRSRGMPPKLY